MKMTLESHDMRYTVETINPKQDDYDSRELKELFGRMMVQSGFPPSAIETDDGGKYEYIDPDYEVVVKKEYLDKLEKAAAQK